MFDSDPSEKTFAAERSSRAPQSSPSCHNRTTGSATSASVPAVSKFVALSEEATRRKEAKELESRYQGVSKAYQKLQEKYDDCYAKMKTYRKKFDTAEKDLGTARLLSTRLAEEKSELEQSLRRNKDYTRKLESMIARGKAGKENLDSDSINGSQRPACGGGEVASKLRGDLEAAEKAVSLTYHIGIAGGRADQE